MDACAAWLVVSEEFSVDFVECSEISHIKEEAGCLDDISLLEASSCDDGVHVAENKLGLSLDIAWEWMLLGLWINGDTAGGVKHVSNNAALDIWSNGSWCIWGGNDGAH